ncbi:MAG: AAA family ATPase [Patescibacteria group bacterium]|jgi:dephospho-CoA kinase
MAKKIILGFVGEMVSGKGTACKYLKEKYNAPSYRFSTILRDVLDRLYLEINRKNMQNLSMILRQNFNENIFAKVIAEDVKNDPAQIITVDGVRRLADISYLKEIPGFYLIYLTADEKIRYQRIIDRGENTDDKNKTFAEFQVEQHAEAENEIGPTGQTANLTITNNGTLAELQEQIEKILKKINES